MFVDPLDAACRRCGDWLRMEIGAVRDDATCYGPLQSPSNLAKEGSHDA